MCHVTGFEQSFHLTAKALATFTDVRQWGLGSLTKTEPDSKEESQMNIHVQQYTVTTGEKLIRHKGLAGGRSQLLHPWHANMVFSVCVCLGGGEYDMAMPLAASAVTHAQLERTCTLQSEHLLTVKPLKHLQHDCWTRSVHFSQNACTSDVLWPQSCLLLHLRARHAS